MSSQNTSAVNDIKAILAQMENGMRTNQLDAITESYDDNIVAYDAVMKLQFLNKKDYTDHWATCLSYAPKGMIYESREPVIHADDNIAFSYNLARCGCYDEDGKEQSSWTRVTRGYKKLNGQWRVIHEHFSFVIDMENGNALFDIQP